MDGKHCSQADSILDATNFLKNLVKTHTHTCYLVDEGGDELGLKDVAKGNPAEESQQCF